MQPDEIEQALSIIREAIVDKAEQFHSDSLLLDARIDELRLDSLT